ncbi:hypothetical protein AN639_03635 [Candidatus Epulonipiscium fishelsonii]|uniref:Uncharacterized protein n=1 Tax=Candidatus Epulonipiscium fishelsonii TaxID=77094 RepID=A0ACC8XDE9_9FIRM|nr:hypothetical protein AN396_00730 [Epulopiscium sp. SCG-B11WGA-EpuloA1]ONI41510.1 hypothetical protein AN639_03635 [Epulopiscium sp. SCG-B05WGA-EpuloA1]ONI46723.1 hypothetical protein AN644_02695 [Epulopiscium sp. SCG-C06WGA-EpuloA1]
MLYHVLCDPIFYIMIALVFCMYKRESGRWELSALKDVARGTIVGTMLSYFITSFGISFNLNFSMLMLIPITILFTAINPKWSCFAYVIPFNFFLGQLCEIFGYKFIIFDLPYTEFIVFIGMLHIVEGILVTLFGHENPRQGLDYNTYEEVTMLNKFWLVPLLIVVGQDGFIPVYTILGYGDTVSNHAIRMRSTSMGSVIVIYGLIDVGLALLTINNIIPLSIGLIFVVIGHECMFLINKIQVKVFSRE